MKLLDNTGLNHLIDIIKNAFANVEEMIAGKVDKVDGKGLSSNDYTTTEKNKLSGIETGANKITVDTALSSSSTNPVQNKVVNSALGGKLDKSGGTMTGDLTLSTTSIYRHGFHLEKRLGGLDRSPNYANWEADKKDGNWHRIWRFSFPTGANFWGKVTIRLYGQYASFNASGTLEKQISLAFNGASCYNNVGCYTDLSGNVEKDFRISEAIWNADTSTWDILIYSDVPSGNNAPSSIMLSCETNNENYLNFFKNITYVGMEISDIVTYNNVCGTFNNTTIVKSFKDVPVYESPYGYQIITENELSSLGITEERHSYTTTAKGIVSYTVPNYTTGCTLDVYINGFHCIPGVHYNISGTTVTTIKALESGQVCEFVLRKVTT